MFDLFYVAFYVDKLDEDAPDGPDINLWAVLGVTDQEFWSSVPSGCHIISEVFAGI